MNNEKIERLDVTAIGDQVRLRELCKEDVIFAQKTFSQKTFSLNAIFILIFSG